jgi:ParB-like chromosome segregation protein Spo0J
VALPRNGNLPLPLNGAAFLAKQDFQLPRRSAGLLPGGRKRSRRVRHRGQRPQDGSRRGHRRARRIAAHGLLQSLVVRKAARGRFAVIAGQRRYLTLSMLAAGDKIPADLPIPCHVVDREADATEIGLAENTVRLAMHLADQFKAFGELIDKGAGIADIAARFGVSETTVAKRLKLGRVGFSSSPCRK